MLGFTLIVRLYVLLCVISMYVHMSGGSIGVLMFLICSCIARTALFIIITFWLHFTYFSCVIHSMLYLAKGKAPIVIFNFIHKKDIDLFVSSLQPHNLQLWRSKWKASRDFKHQSIIYYHIVISQAIASCQKAWSVHF